MGVHSIFHWQCWFDLIRSIFDLVCSVIFCYFVFFCFVKLSLMGHRSFPLGSITSRSSRGGMQTRHERAAEIEPIGGGSN